MTDTAFINRFLPRFPEWRERPGEIDASTLLDIARELGLANHVEISRDYDRVLDEYRAGRSVLVTTERAPEQSKGELATGRYDALIVDMNADAFTLWCPFPSGQSDNLPKAAREWWDRWLAVGIVLYADKKTGVSEAGASN